MEYVSKRVTIQAEQWQGDGYVAGMYEGPEGPLVLSKNGPVKVNPGDWIIKGDGEYYPCPADVFAKMYEPAIVDRAVNPTIENNFRYHAPKEGQPEKYVAIREKAKELAYLIDELVPKSREQSLAFTNLEQAVFWANAGIARN